MLDRNITLAFYDNTDPGVAGWLVLAVWFILFVLFLNTFIFFLRRLWRRRRAGMKQAPPPVDEKEIT